MNYYYDVILNWGEDEVYDFFEWNETDYLELIKKIPVFKVKHKIFLDIITNNIKVDSDFLNLIKDKTLVSGEKSLTKIDYACLILDGKSVIALEFLEDGHIINRSKLLIDDELNVLELTYSLKEYDLNYEIINNLPIRKNLRQIEEAKRLILLEITNLYNAFDKDKLQYLYYEYKKEKIEDINTIYQVFREDLSNKFNNNLMKLYYIIKYYHKV